MASILLLTGTSCILKLCLGLFGPQGQVPWVFDLSKTVQHKYFLCSFFRPEVQFKYEVCFSSEFTQNRFSFYSYVCSSQECPTRRSAQDKSSHEELARLIS